MAHIIGAAHGAGMTLLMLLSMPAGAQPDQPPKKEPLETDRPDFTESAGTIAPGRFQLEGGYTFSRSGTDRQHAYGEVLLRIGTGARSELRVGMNSYSVTTMPGSALFGLEDMEIGAKFKLVEPSKTGLRHPRVSLLIGTTLPTGSSAYRENAIQPEAKFLLAWELTERLGLSSNIGLALPSEQGRRFTQLIGSLSASYSLADRLGSYVEYYGLLPGGRGGPNANYVNAGLTYLLSDDLQIDARIGRGLSGTRPDDFYGVGAAVRW
jgi:hypothetical protein